MLNKQIMVTAETALPDRKALNHIQAPHYVNQSDISLEKTESQQEVLLGMGCFWGAERLFWSLEGVVSTSVGYSGGFTQNPSYEDVCSGKTGHTEVVRVVFNPELISLHQLLNLFWERHDPTQGMKQGNDLGTQYRSAIYVYDESHVQSALESKAQYQDALSNKDKNEITTEIKLASDYFFAEEHHQQYLAKNPNGYCGLGGTGVCFPA